MTCNAQREAQLTAQGWRRQFTASGPRLEEAVAAYREMGFLVHLEAVDPGACRQAGVCSSCFDDPQAAAQIKVIFTRRP